jgi:hypothetical protein
MNTDFDPHEFVEARVNVNAARAFDLQIGTHSPGGARSLLGHWREAAYGVRPLTLRIPPLENHGELFVLLHLIGEEEDGLVDVELDLAQNGLFLPGSGLHLREHAFSKVARLLVRYLLKGDRIELWRPPAKLLHLDEGSWRREPVSNLIVPVLASLQREDASDRPEHSSSRDGDEGEIDIGREVLRGPGRKKQPPVNGDGSPSRGPGGDPPRPEREATTERQINVWIAERASLPDTPLVRGERYQLCINVGGPVAASLTKGPEAEISDEDIPPAGLEMEWMVHSYAAELQPLSTDVRVTRHEGGNGPWWTARFSLHVPRGTNSDIVRMACIPRAIQDVRLRTLVYVCNPMHPERAEPYRDLDVDLWVVEPRTLAAGSTVDTVASSVVRLVDEVMHSPTAHLNLNTAHEWTTPNDVLSITVLAPGSALVKGGAGGLSIDHETHWEAVQTTVSGSIANVRAALERFREQHEPYLDAVDPKDLDGRLARQEAGADFFGCGDPPDPAALAAWDAVSLSPELRELAIEGRTLYDKFFPLKSELRGWVDKLQVHDRLDINCQPRAGTAYVPHVPWGLMYRLDPPLPGNPVNPQGFLGLALRLGYSAHRIPVPSKALGRIDKVHRAFFFYWGDQPKDLTAVEAQWQRNRWAAVANHVVVPSATGTGSPKQQLLTLLDTPVPAPTSLLYLYCQCKAGPGNAPELRFANNAQPENVVRRVELGATALADRPLVFANACTTSSADPYMANELEASFFDRGARAYLGTEGKVPIVLASRFATIFFHYFDRKASPEPIAAGEAVYQARHFLWRHYRNLGGLFYTYVNQYELYMADDAEVRILQIH